MPLTSSQNPLLRKIRRAVLSGRATDDGLIATEGPHLLAEAMDSPWRVQMIVCSDTGFERHQTLVDAASTRHIQITQVSDRAFKSISDTEQNQGILSLLQPRAFTLATLLAAPGPLVILDNIQDPGNAGTVLRSIEAFAGCGAVFVVGCVKIANGKLLRAAAGSVFRLPFVENISAVEIIRTLQTVQRPLFSLVADGPTSLANTCLTGEFALVVGSEGRGLSDIFIEASQRISIYTCGVESLNAATACSIALYEATRQAGLQTRSLKMSLPS